MLLLPSPVSPSLSYTSTKRSAYTNCNRPQSGLPKNFQLESQQKTMSGQSSKSKLSIGRMEMAHASQAPSSDATSLPAVVSTPSLELPSAFPPQQVAVNGAPSDDSTSTSNALLDAPAQNDAAQNSAMSRSNSFSRSPVRGKHARKSTMRGSLAPPVCFPAFDEPSSDATGSSTDLFSQASSSKMVLELADGTAYQGFSFGAQGKSISGECVFQTGQSAFSRYFPPSFPFNSMMSVLVGTSL